MERIVPVHNGLDPDQGYHPERLVVPIPEGLDPARIYHSEQLAEFWQLSRTRKERWYSALRQTDAAANAGYHFVMTGEVALAALIAACAGARNAS